MDEPPPRFSAGGRRPGGRRAERARRRLLQAVDVPQGATGRIACPIDVKREAVDAAVLPAGQYRPLFPGHLGHRLSVTQNAHLSGNFRADKTVRQIKTRDGLAGAAGV